MSIVRQDKGPRMSQAVIHNGVIYSAGQVGEGPDMAAQTKDVLAKIDALLANAGSDKSKILSATIWITDMADFAEMNAVWDAWVDRDNAPARACTQAPLALPKFKVEIMVIAAI